MSKDKRPDWHYCHECQIKAGAEVPKRQGAITVMEGTCTDCGKEGVTLIPNQDYNSPKLGKKYVWD